jgi:hypothetical protein
MIKNFENFVNEDTTQKNKYSNIMFYCVHQDFCTICPFFYYGEDFSKCCCSDHKGVFVVLDKRQGEKVWTCINNRWDWEDMNIEKYIEKYRKNLDRDDVEQRRMVDGKKQVFKRGERPEWVPID